MTTSTVYDFEMPKFIQVQMRGVEIAASIQADKVEVTSKGKLILK